jgi:hypothetical protein
MLFSPHCNYEIEYYFFRYKVCPPVLGQLLSYGIGGTFPGPPLEAVGLD